MLGKYFKGAYPIPELMKLKRSEILFWYNIYELQITEEEIVNGILNPKRGNPGRLPSPEKMRKLVNEKIKQRREKIYG